MAFNRLALVVVVVCVVAGRAAAAGGDGSPGKPIRTDAARIRQLVQIVQGEPDEQKRRTAVLELGRADPRHSADVIQAVCQALLKDTSAAVRLTAVEVIGGYRMVFTIAGPALETALDADSSGVVREAARQALWDYHLMGYRSARARERLLAQTPEPPLARPGRPPLPATSEPPVRTAVGQLMAPGVPLLPVAGPSPGPRVSPPPIGPVAMLASSWPISYQTHEPPLALRPGYTTTTGRSPAVTEPPILPPAPQPLPAAVATPPPPGLFLPPLVADPGPIPGVGPRLQKQPPIRGGAER